MFALLYLLFLGCLGFFLFCVDLIRWPISRFQFAPYSFRHGFSFSAKKRTNEALVKDKMRAF
jgi:hypothetical protein